MAQLRIAALAAALIAQAAPAHAEVVTLVCQNDGPAQGGGSFTLRVDYDRKIVELLSSDGTSRFSSVARITDSDVKWHAAIKEGDGLFFEGSLDRLSGQGLANFPQSFGARGILMQGLSGPCRRATRKF
jgi:hypothetical protein